MLADAAMGRCDADLILKNGMVLDVFTGKYEKKDILIYNSQIAGLGEYSGKNEIDIEGKYVIPGLIDSHVHIESSMTMPYEYAKTVIPHGVTTVIADPHEITNVCGRDGLKFMKESAEGLSLDILYMLPSCVPATPFEHSGAVISAEDIKELIPEFFGIGEMMNYPGVISADKETHEKLTGSNIDGHAPLLSGKELDAYISSGIKTDHECSNINEMREKISKGMYIALREGTLSKDIDKLAKGITPYTMHRCTFCTDDKFIGDIIENGSVDNCIRKAVKCGISPEDAVIMATLNAAQCYNIPKKGAAAPSYIADLVISEDKLLNNIFMVLKNGEIVFSNGTAKLKGELKPADKVTGTVHLDELGEEFFKCDIPSGAFDAIELVPGQIITKKVRISNMDGVSKLCVIERHKGTGNKGFGFVTNYGIENGAIASSIGHDSHNIAVIGDNDTDMAAAVNALGKSGGIAVASKGKAVSVMKLDIAGLMSLKDAYTVKKEHDDLMSAARRLGVNPNIDPFLSLAFLPLPVIPEIRVTDMGLFDVTEFKFI